MITPRPREVVVTHRQSVAARRQRQRRITYVHAVGVQERTPAHDLSLRRVQPPVKIRVGQRVKVKRRVGWQCEGVILPLAGHGNRVADRAAENKRVGRITLGHEVEGEVAAGMRVIYPPLHRHRVRSRLRQRERVHVRVDAGGKEDVPQRSIESAVRCVCKSAPRLAVKIVAVTRIPVELVKHRAVGRTQRAAHHRAGRQHRRVREVQQSKLITPRHPGDGQLIAASRQRQQWVGDVRAVGV